MTDTSQALCKEFHSDFWFPPVFFEERQGKESEYYEVAKHVCEHCPIKSWCREEGAEEEFGVWGGVTPRERRKGHIRPSTKVLPLDKAFELIPPPSPNTTVPLQEVRQSIKPFLTSRKG